MRRSPTAGPKAGCCTERIPAEEPGRKAIKRIWMFAALLWLAAGAGQALADGRAGVAKGQAYKRFGQYVSWY